MGFSKMFDYEIAYLIDAKRQENIHHDDFGKSWDVFISAYNDSDRVRAPFQKAKTEHKYWLDLPEYEYAPLELPQDAPVLKSANRNEASYIIDVLNSLIDESDTRRFCFDITGLMRPHILFLMAFLKSKRIHRFDFIYTEPMHYKRKEETSFSLDDVLEVRQVACYEGSHQPDMANDVLIIGIGYDHNLISRVILSKESARLVQLHSLPSLSADMYQESLLRLERVASAPVKIPEDQLFFSSANDPYTTAANLAKAYRSLNQPNPITNLYLSPLATKPQTVGFGIFYLKELRDKAASIIFPFAQKYARETSEGVGKTWVYPIHFND